MLLQQRPTDSCRDPFSAVTHAETVRSTGRANVRSFSLWLALQDFRTQYTAWQRNRQNRIHQRKPRGANVPKWRYDVPNITHCAQLRSQGVRSRFCLLQKISAKSLI